VEASVRSGCSGRRVACKIRKNAAGTAASTVNFIAAARRRATASQKAKSTERSDGAEPAKICQRHHNKTAAEQNDSGEQKKTSFGVDRGEARKREQRHGMIKLSSTALFQTSSRP